MRRAFTILFCASLLGACSGGGGGSPRGPGGGTPAGSPPTGVVAVATTSQVLLGWLTVSGATSYNIYWDTNPGVTQGTGNAIPGVAAPPYQHNGLTNGTVHYYVVTAVDAAGETADSAEAYALPLAAPTGLAATAAPGEVTLSWNPVTGAAGYNVYWSTSPGVTRFTGNRLTPPGSPLVHGGLTNGTTYYYVVTATTTVAAGSESTESSEVSAIPNGGAVGLDPTFGGQGWIIHHDAAGGNDNDAGSDITLDRFGRMLVTGYSQNNSGDREMVIWRYLDNGILDPTFNGQGWITHDGAAGGTGNDEGFAIALDSADRVVVVGISASPAGDSDMAVWRYLSNGLLDTTFDGRGWITYDGGFSGWDWGLDMHLDSLDRIVVGGFTRRASGDYDMTVWRYLPDGRADLSFNGQGVVFHHDAAGGGMNDMGFGMTQDAGGRILVSGWSQRSMLNWDMIVWRFQTDGSLDTTFGGQGWVVHDAPAGGGDWDEGIDIRVDGAGRILTAGIGRNANGDFDLVIWRYDADGMLDTTFNGQGWVVHHNAGGGNGDDWAEGIAIDSSGRILASGVTASATVGEMPVWRYNADGSLDSTFNGQGWITHDNAAGGTGPDRGAAITLDSQERIVVTGNSENASGNFDMVIWRFR
ncbi:MAG: hypothetical protein O7H41_16815 [Planctomycetota bacterium]|nr:hypothetical protein [Planctomycetota bacterium]